MEKVINVIKTDIKEYLLITNMNNFYTTPFNLINEFFIKHYLIKNNKLMIDTNEESVYNPIHLIEDKSIYMKYIL
jgi:hypothetical protein